MRITIRNKLILGFGSMVLMFVGFGIAMLVSMSDVQKRFGFVVEHDAPVIDNANRLFKLVVDMETGQRGFCITQKEEFLEPYDRAITEFDTLIKAEKVLVSDNPSQKMALDRIEDLVEQWQVKAARPEIAMARKVATHEFDAQHLQDILAKGVGKKLIDQFMALGHEIEASFLDEGDWEGAFAVEIIEKSLADREDSQRGFLITGREDFLEKYVAGEQKKLPQYFSTLRAIISHRGRGDELFTKVDQLEALAHEWAEKAAEPEIAIRREMNIHFETLKDVAALLEAGTGKALLDQIRVEFEAFIRVENELTTQHYAKASQTYQETRQIVIGMILFSIVVGFFVTLWVIRVISGSIKQIIKGARIVGAGNLDHRISIDNRDELGELALSFNEMVEKLKLSENDLQEVMRSVERTSQDLSQIMNSSPDFIFKSRIEDFKFIEVNDTACEFYGYTQDEFLEMEIFDIEVDPPLKDQVRQLYDATPVGEVVEVYGVNKKKNGETFPVQVRFLKLDEMFALANVRDITGQKKVQEELATYRNHLEELVSEQTKDIQSTYDKLREEVAERVEAEEQLKESEFKRRTWLESSPVCTKIIDPDFNLQYMSHAGVEGLAIDDITEFYGKRYPLEFYPESSKESITACLEIAKETGDIQANEISVVSFNGDELWFSSTFVPINDKEGQLDYFIVVSVDSTERRKAQKQLQAYQENLEAMIEKRTTELSISNKSLVTEVAERKLAEEVIRKHKEKLQLMALELSLTEAREQGVVAHLLHDGISQDLATALLKLKSLNGHVPKGVDSSDLDDVRDIIVRTINEVQSLTFDLSYVGDLNRFGFARSMANWMEVRVQEKHGIKAELIDDGQEKPMTEKMRVLLFQVVRELLMNVIKHSRTKSVQVMVQKNGSFIEVIVLDDGVGFDPSEIESASPRRDGGGFGLLSIRERLNYIGAEMTIESRKGHGSKITLRIPMELNTDVEENDHGYQNSIGG